MVRKSNITKERVRDVKENSFYIKQQGEVNANHSVQKKKLQ